MICKVYQWVIDTHSQVSLLSYSWAQVKTAREIFLFFLVKFFSRIFFPIFDPQFSSNLLQPTSSQTFLSPSLQPPLHSPSCLEMMGRRPIFIGPLPPWKKSNTGSSVPLINFSLIIYLIRLSLLNRFYFSGCRKSVGGLHRVHRNTDSFWSLSSHVFSFVHWLVIGDWKWKGGEMLHCGLNMCGTGSIDGSIHVVPHPHYYKRIPN